MTLDEQAVLEFLSSVSVDICFRWTTNYIRNISQQFTLDEQFVDAAMPFHLSVKRNLEIYPKQRRMQKANVRAFKTPEQTLNGQETDKCVYKTRNLKHSPRATPANKRILQIAHGPAHEFAVPRMHSSPRVCTLVLFIKPSARMLLFYSPRVCTARVLLLVCVSVTLNLTSGMFVRLTNHTTNLTGNEGQKICGGFSENAPLQS